MSREENEALGRSRLRRGANYAGLGMYDTSTLRATIFVNFRICMRCIDPVGDMLILYSASENAQNFFAIGQLHGMRYRTSSYVTLLSKPGTS